MPVVHAHPQPCLHALDGGTEAPLRHRVDIAADAMRHREDVLAEADEPGGDHVSPGAPGLEALQHHGHLEGLSDEGAHVGVHGLQGEALAEAEGHELVPGLALGEVPFVLADHQGQPPRHRLHELQVQDAGGVEGLHLGGDELGVQIGELELADEFAALIQQRPLPVHGLAGHVGEVVEEVGVVKVLVRHPHLVAQAAPHHLAHDLPVQGGEVHHVQVEDQVDGIVLVQGQQASHVAVFLVVLSVGLMGPHQLHVLLKLLSLGDRRVRRHDRRVRL
mmetsp:Transcript_34640/g.83100  ORF Transcript_34640/g.83100 Transcript_34640/m.83100 type:complete len:276 (+) Transcript_34640:3785-4612(+)